MHSYGGDIAINKSVRVSLLCQITASIDFLESHAMNKTVRFCVCVRVTLFMPSPMKCNNTMWSLIEIYFQLPLGS